MRSRAITANTPIHPLWSAVSLSDRLVDFTSGIARLPGCCSNVRWPRFLCRSAMALLAVGIARMLAVPVFTLFLMGVILSWRDDAKVSATPAFLKDTGCWPSSFSSLSGRSPVAGFHLGDGAAGGRSAIRAGIGQMLSLALSGGSLPLGKRLLAGVGIQRCRRPRCHGFLRSPGSIPKSDSRHEGFRGGDHGYCRSGPVPFRLEPGG